MKHICLIALLVVILIVMAVILTGCQKSFEGEVCELELKEAYTTTVILPITIFNGKTNTVIMVPHIRTYPDRYRVKVKTFDVENNKYTYNECYVTKECFEQLKIGDWFVYDKDYCFDSEPYTQTRE